MNLFIFSKKINENFAHRVGEKFEPFLEHVDRTKKYYDILIKYYDISKTINKFLKYFKVDTKHFETIREIIKFHDIGKLTKKFQKGLKNGKVDITHSDIGFYVILIQLIDKVLTNEISEHEFKFLSILSTVVHRHHSYLKNINNLSLYNDSKKEYIMKIASYMSFSNNNITDLIDKAFIFLKKFKQISSMFKNLEFFFFYKLINSLLITSDYLATLEFMKNIEFEPQIIDKELSKIIEKNILTKSKFNPIIDENFDYYLKLNVFRNINELRSSIAANVEKNFESSKNKNIFFIEVPTGGGKTNISLRLIRKLLLEKKKVFYVLPFINIIEQNYDYYSNFVPYDKITRYDHKYFDYPDDEKSLESHYIETLFLNFPFVFSTHIGFFEMFFGNRKSENFNFYQLTNSIIVLDEIQAYNPNLWNALSHIFSILSEYFNATIIIMSATLPDLRKFLDEKRKNSIENITPNDLITNKLFDRVETEFIENFEQQLYREIEDGRRKILVVVNTIKDSYKLYTKLKNKYNDYAEVYILNSTLLDSRKKEIINYIKNYDGNKPLILVSTQSIEAGVDLDFDVGFRAFTLLDSIIQTMGRINRNGRIKSAKLYLFDDGKWKRIYSSDERKKILEENFSKFKEKELTLKKFYDITIEKLKQKANTKIIKEYLQDLNNLNFEEINKIKLINGNNFSLFIPLEIPISKISRLKPFLFKFKIISSDEKYLSGERVWNFLQDNNFESFAEYKLFSKIFSLFTISLFNYKSNTGKNIKEQLKDEMFGELYFAEDYKEYYSYESGLDVEKFLEIKSNREFDFI